MWGQVSVVVGMEMHSSRRSDVAVTVWLVPHNSNTTMEQPTMETYHLRRQELINSRKEARPPRDIRKEIFEKIRHQVPGYSHVSPRRFWVC